MPRSKLVKKRIREPDSKYKSRIVAKMINMIMQDGKKTIARDIVYNSIEKLDPEDTKEARRIFEESIKNIMPELEVRTRRVGGANYQIPIPIRHDRAETLALRWLISSAQEKSGKSMVERLSSEMRQAYNNEGAAVSKKINTHKMADANKAFAHFKW